MGEIAKGASRTFLEIEASKNGCFTVSNRGDQFVSGPAGILFLGSDESILDTARTYLPQPLPQGYPPEFPWSMISFLALPDFVRGQTQMAIPVAAFG